MMKTKILKTKFDRATRFEVKPVAATFRVTPDAELEKLKSRLLLEWLGANYDPELNAPLRRAANEAAALAWATQFPLLFFPTLLAEKAQLELRRVEKQREVFQRTKNLFNQPWPGLRQTPQARPAAQRRGKPCDLAVCE